MIVNNLIRRREKVYLRLQKAWPQESEPLAMIEDEVISKRRKDFMKGSEIGKVKDVPASSDRIPAAIAFVCVQQYTVKYRHFHIGKVMLFHNFLIRYEILE